MRGRVGGVPILSSSRVSTEARPQAPAQASAPLVDVLRDYAARDMAAFHTPGHKQGRAVPSELRALMGPDVFRVDLTRLPETDSLHEPTGVLKEAQALAADAYGAEESWFLVNGSTAGNLAMLLATCGPGDEVLVPRNAHRSILSGLVLTGARPVYLRPEWDEALGLDHCVTAEAYERALDAHPNVRAACALHPTYHGAVADLRRISEACHARGKPLLVDEAHGPHFRFHPELPASALEAGADLVVQSSHKLTSAMTQASLLHARYRAAPSGRPLVEPARLRQALQLVQSTSPSYVLMASLDAARRQLALEGERLWGEAVSLAEDARRRLNRISGVRVFGRERVGRPGLFDLDVTRLTVEVTGLGVTGFELLPLLGSAYGIQPEMATLHHVLLLVTPGNTASDLDRVVDAFRTLSERGLPSAIPGLAAVPGPLPSPCAIPALAMTPRDAFFAPAETVRFESSVGRVSAELVAPYPPGIPVLAPGEVVSAESVEYLRRLQRMGATLHGPEDAQLRTLKVVADRRR